MDGGSDLLCRRCYDAGKQDKDKADTDFHNFSQFDRLAMELLACQKGVLPPVAP
jgi:hypothetical protein